ncbi:MAG: NAD-dependent epimerase/dehydratase family protein [Smithella sp.]
MSKTIFITGGSGFIGKNLVEKLTDYYEILAPAHHELELLDENAVTHFFQTHNIDIIIHCATKPGHRNAPDPTGLIFNNTRMFFNLIRNSRLYKKMILLTSGAVYDMRYYQPKMEENYFDTHVPVDETGYSKYICAKYAEAMDNIIELRPFGVFGKYEDWEIRFISNMICKALFDLPLTIKQNRYFDYIYINDLIMVIRHFIEHQTSNYKVYNVTPDHALELKNIAEMVLDIAGKELDIIIENPELGIEYSGCNKRLEAEIPEVSKTDIFSDIASLYQWYANHLYLINPELLLKDK